MRKSSMKMRIRRRTRTTRNKTLSTINQIAKYRISNTFSDLTKTKDNTPGEAPQIDNHCQIPKIYLANTLPASWAWNVLRYSLTAIPGTHWQLCPRLSQLGTRLTLMMFNTRATTIKATIQRAVTTMPGDHQQEQGPPIAHTKVPIGLLISEIENQYLNFLDVEN